MVKQVFPARFLIDRQAVRKRTSVQKVKPIYVLVASLQLTVNLTSCSNLFYTGAIVINEFMLNAFIFNAKVHTATP